MLAVWQEVAEMSDRDTLRQKNMEDLKSKWKKFLKRQAEKKNAEQGKQTQMH